ncbi:hypothetical protein HED51_22955 [Ochrobactrum grignonense]|nr:hypothetical protein [Brucella grignonensis]
MSLKHWRRKRRSEGIQTTPSGKSVDEDIEIHAAVREAVGPHFPLMSDPVAFMTLPEAVRYGRGLERLGYLWLEEPIQDENFSSLRELTRILDIPVIGTEVLGKHPYSVAECISTKVVDAVRADVSWTGGVTGTLKTAHLAESFNANCEVHSAIFQPLDLVNLHICAAIRNCSFFELLSPEKISTLAWQSQSFSGRYGCPPGSARAGCGSGLEPNRKRDFRPRLTRQIGTLSWLVKHLTAASSSPSPLQQWWRSGFLKTGRRPWQGFLSRAISLESPLTASPSFQLMLIKSSLAE